MRFSCGISEWPLKCFGSILGCENNIAKYHAKIIWKDIYHKGTQLPSSFSVAGNAQSYLDFNTISGEKIATSELNVMPASALCRQAAERHCLIKSLKKTK